MEDPSKCMPSAKAVSSSAGVMAKDFSCPVTSVNQSRIRRTARSSTVRSTYSCWRIIAGSCCARSWRVPEPAYGGAVHEPFTFGQRGR